MLIHSWDNNLKLSVLSQYCQLYLTVVNGRKRQDNFLGGRGDWVAVTVIVNVVILFLLCQPGCGILCHVAEVGFLQRAQHLMWKTEPVCFSPQHPGTSNRQNSWIHIQLYNRWIHCCPQSYINCSVICWHTSTIKHAFFSHFLNKKINLHKKNNSIIMILNATCMVR